MLTAVVLVIRRSQKHGSHENRPSASGIQTEIRRGHPPAPQHQERDVTAHHPDSSAGQSIATEVGARCKELLLKLGQATERDAPDAAIELLIRMGEMIRSESSGGQARQYFMTCLMRGQDAKLLGVVALAIAVYSEPPSKQVRELLRTAKEAIPTSYALAFSLALPPAPESWDRSTQAMFWRELFMHIPEIIPRSKERERMETELGSWTYDVLDLSTTRKISDPTILDDFFSYVSRTSDAQLACRMSGKLQPTDPRDLDAFLGAYREARRPEVKNALLLHARRFPTLSIDQMKQWYREESEPKARHALASEILSRRAADPIAWIDTVYMSEASPSVKSLFIGTLARTRSEAALQRLNALVLSGSVTERQEAVSQITVYEQDYALGFKEKLLLQAATDPDPGVRWRALAGLHALCGAKHRALFEDLASRDVAERVRIAAQGLLDRLNSNK
jgi:hypothetical protein